ncbi:MAG: ferredoxin [Actinomycetia bacterium]|nr:ferredoxin [Actinomycetes bacterium]
MRVHVDIERCTGHARCQDLAPDVYELDDDGYNTTPTYEVAPGMEEQARRGALGCPELAITVEE